MLKLETKVKRLHKIAEKIMNEGFKSLDEEEINLVKDNLNLVYEMLKEIYHESKQKPTRKYERFIIEAYSNIERELDTFLFDLSSPYSKLVFSLSVILLLLLIYDLLNSRLSIFTIYLSMGVLVFGLAEYYRYTSLKRELINIVKSLDDEELFLILFELMMDKEHAIKILEYYLEYKYKKHKRGDAK